MGRTKAYEDAAEAAAHAGGAPVVLQPGAAGEGDQEWWMVYKVPTPFPPLIMRSAHGRRAAQTHDPSPALALLRALGDDSPLPSDDRGPQGKRARSGSHSPAQAAPLSADEELAAVLALSEREAQEASDLAVARALSAQ